MTWPYLSGPTPFGIAHRGGDTAAPENTMAAFANAVAAGYTHLETDVHLTRDGVLVAFHDDNLERLTGNPERIRDLTATEVQAVDLGGGHHIPLMEDLFKAFPDARFNIDPKSDESVAPLADLINRYHMIDQVCIGSFSDDRITEIRQRLGDRLCTSPGPKQALRIVLAAIFWPRWSPPNGCLQIPVEAHRVRFDRPWLIRRIQRLGLQVHFWTINERNEMERLLDAGADALISDKVELLNDVLATRSAGRPSNGSGDHR